MVKINPNWTLWNEIGFKITMLKCRFSLLKSDLYHKAMRKKFCRHGYHKLTTCAEGHGKQDKKRRMRMSWFRYLKCAHCNFIFFASKADKKRYQKMKAEDESRLKTAVSAMMERFSSAKSKHSKRVGNRSKGDASARG